MGYLIRFWLKEGVYRESYVNTKREVKSKIARMKEVYGTPLKVEVAEVSKFEVIKMARRKRRRTVRRRRTTRRKRRTRRRR